MPANDQGLSCFVSRSSISSDLQWIDALHGVCLQRHSRRKAPATVRPGCLWSRLLYSESASLQAVIRAPTLRTRAEHCQQCLVVVLAFSSSPSLHRVCRCNRLSCWRLQFFVFSSCSLTGCGYPFNLRQHADSPTVFYKPKAESGLGERPKASGHFDWSDVNTSFNSNGVFLLMYKKIVLLYRNAWRYRSFLCCAARNKPVEPEHARKH